MASELHSELIVVHVAAPAAVRVFRLGPSIARARLLDDPYSSVVLLGARRVAWSNGAPARIVLMDGDTVPAILTAAEEFDVDLLVLWTSESRAPAILARTRWQIERRSPRPVMTVPVCGRHPASAIRTAIAP